MISLRVVVQRCPAVPTAPKIAARNAILRSAYSDIIMALLPPSSSKERPRRAATAVPTALPMRVDPVADISGMRVSLLIHSPHSLLPITRPQTPSGTLFALNTSAIIFWQAIAESGVFSDGFHTQVLPHISAIILFQLHTATGKLKALMM